MGARTSTFPGSLGKAPRAVLALVASVCLLAPSVQAQTLHGTVREDPSGAAIEGADLTLLAVDGSVAGRGVSDQAGSFTIVAGREGVYRLRAIRIGYASFTSEPFLAQADQSIEADVFLAVRPVELPPLDVVTEARDQRLHQVGFLRRRELGLGHFLTREEIQARHADRTADVFRGIPGVEVVSAGAMGTFDLVMRGGRTLVFRIQPDTRDGPLVCYPSISIDGQVVRVGGVQPNRDSGAQPRDVGQWSYLVHPSDLEAVEVYPGGAGMPVQGAGQISPCGAVLIWTRG